MNAKQLVSFLDGMKTKENAYLIEAIEKGCAILESVPSDFSVAEVDSTVLPLDVIPDGNAKEVEKEDVAEKDAANDNELDVLKGGRADGKTIQDVADKWNVPVEEIQKQVDVGSKVELEHTELKKIAERIALDHLMELPDYYDRLDEMEEEGEAELKGEDLEKGDECKTIDCLAAKHGVEESEIAEELTKGLKVELERTKDPEKALKAAVGHLYEMPDYYTAGMNYRDETGEDLFGADDETDEAEEATEGGEQESVGGPKKYSVMGNDGSIEDTDLTYDEALAMVKDAENGVKIKEIQPLMGQKQKRGK